MDEKFKLRLATVVNVLAWGYLALSAGAVGVAAYGRFLVGMPGCGFGIFDVLLLLLALGVAVGGFWLLRAIAKRLDPAKQ